MRGLWIIGALARDESLENMKFQSCYEHETKKSQSPAEFLHWLDATLFPGSPGFLRGGTLGTKLGRMLLPLLFWETGGDHVLGSIYHTPPTNC